MKRVLFLLAILFLCFSCKKEEKDTKISNQQFDTYKNNFIDSLWKMNPDWAAGQGFHKYDSVLKVPTNAYRKEQLQFVNSQLDSLKNYTVEELSSNNTTDYYMIKNYLASEKE